LNSSRVGLLLGPVPVPEPPPLPDVQPGEHARHDVLLPGQDPGGLLRGRGDDVSDVPHLREGRRRRGARLPVSLSQRNGVRPRPPDLRRMGGRRLRHLHIVLLQRQLRPLPHRIRYSHFHFPAASSPPGGVAHAARSRLARYAKLVMSSASYENAIYICGPVLKSEHQIKYQFFRF
jgi:hypothetical protein